MHSIRIWLDDERPMPKGYDVHCKTYADALTYVIFGNISHISFDHDLGEDKTGYDLAKDIEYQASYRNNRMTWDIHSANPVGRKNIAAAMNNAERFWREYDENHQQIP